MGFAQEVRDFTAAFSAVSNALNQGESDLDRANTQSLIDLRKAEMDKIKWELGAEDRERADILSFGAGEDVIPWGTQPSQPLAVGGDQANFVNTLRPYAQKVSELTGMDPDLVLAQSALETGWGKKAPGNNYFGIKGPGQTFDTTEYVDGQKVATSDSFRAYNSPEESFQDYAEFLRGGRYADVLQAGSAEEQARALQAAGYATDPEYANKLIEMTNRIRGLGSTGGGGGGYTDLSGLAKIGQSDVAQGVGQTMQQPRGLVIHHTGGRGTAEGVMTTLNERGFSVQYVIDRDGKIYQTLPEGAAGQHIRNAENGSGLDNSNAFGVEVIANDDSDVTPQQVEAAKRLATDLGSRYGFDPSNVFGHGEINAHKQHTEGSTIVNAIRQGLPVIDTGTTELAGTEPISGADMTAAGVVEPNPMTSSTGATMMVPTPRPRPGEEEAIPTEGAEGTPGVVGGAGGDRLGYDPYGPGGLRNPVTSAGHESLSPGAPDEAAVRVARGEGDDIPIRKIMQNVIGWGKQAVGAQPGAVPTGQPDPGTTAHMEGVAAAPAGLIKEMENAVDPKGEMSPDVRRITALKKVYNYYRLKGDEKRANAAAYAVFSSYRKMSNMLLGLSQAKVDEGKLPEAMELFMEAYDLMPDGEVLDVQQNPDGTFTVKTEESETGKVTTSQVMTSEDIMARIMNWTPDEFEAMILKPVLGEKPTPNPNLDAASQAYEELYGDGAVPEGPPPATGSEVTPPVPEISPTGVMPRIPPDAASVSPMGGTTIPPDAIQVASIDEAIPTSATGDTATEPGVAETGVPETVAATGGDALRETVPREYQINPEPRKPPAEPDFRAFVDKQPAEWREYLTSRYDRDVAIYNEWVKTLETPAEADAKVAMNDFFTRLKDADDNEVFSDFEDLIGRVPNASLQGSMRLAAQAHNDAAKLLNDETDLEISNAILEELTRRYIPSQYTGTIPGTGEAVPEEPGIISGDYSTPIQGDIPAQGDVLSIGDIPEADQSLLLGLNKDDRAVFEKRMADANAGIAKENEAFVPLEPAITVSGVTAVDDDTLQEALTATLEGMNTRATTAAEAANQQAQGADPQAVFKKGVNDFLTAKIADPALGIDATLRGAAREMMRMPKNYGLSDPRAAMEAARDLILFDAMAPTEPPFSAQRIPPGPGVPEGMVELTAKANPAIKYTLPEQMFVQLDQVRMGLAQAWIDDKRGRVMELAAPPAEPWFDPTGEGGAAWREEQARRAINDRDYRQQIPYRPGMQR